MKKRFGGIIVIEDGVEKAHLYGAVFIIRIYASAKIISPILKVLLYNGHLYLLPLSCGNQYREGSIKI